MIPGFTAKYRCHRLVWFEHYKYVYAALEREKQIKGWARAKKIELIERMNPSWSDLSEAWRAATADPLRFAPVGMTRGGPLLYERLATRMDRVNSGYSAATADPSTALRSG